jgi:hypothetical protein
MSKTTLAKEIQKEIQKLNNRIDEKIVKGEVFTREARRHKELLATLRRIEQDVCAEPRATRVTFFRKRSPVRRSIDRGVVARLFTFRMA